MQNLHSSKQAANRDLRQMKSAAWNWRHRRSIILGIFFLSRLQFNGWKAGKDRRQTTSQTSSHTTRQHPTLPDIIPHYQTTSHTTRQHPTLPDSIPHYQTTSHTTRHHPTLPDIIQHYQTSSHTTRHHPTLPDNIPHYQTTSHTARQHPTLPDNIQHYQTACPTTRQHPTLPESKTDFIQGQGNWSFPMYRTTRTKISILGTSNIK